MSFSHGAAHHRLHASLGKSDDVRSEGGHISLSAVFILNKRNSPRSSLSWKKVGMGAQTPALSVRELECPLLVPLAVILMVLELLVVLRKCMYGSKR